MTVSSCGCRLVDSVTWTRRYGDVASQLSATSLSQCKKSEAAEYVNRQSCWQCVFTVLNSARKLRNIGGGAGEPKRGLNAARTRFTVHVHKSTPFWLLEAR